MKKYEIRYDSRIVALIAGVWGDAGTVGGFVDSEYNLSHEGDCWIYDDSWASHKSRILDNAKLMGGVMVRGDTIVHGDTVLSGEKPNKKKSRKQIKKQITELLKQL